MSSVCEKRYAAEARYLNFHTGGDIAWSASGRQLYCLNGDVVNEVNVETGQISHSFGANVKSSDEKSRGKRDVNDDNGIDEDTITCFALSAEHLVTAHRSGLLRLWEVDTQKMVKLWKAQHKGPVVKIEFSPCGRIICSSGGADATLRLWDFQNSSCLGALKEFSGPATLVRFHPNVLRQEVYAVTADNSVYCWNYETKSLLYKMRGHLSQVTDLSFESEASDCRKLVTVSRDKVLIVWKLDEDNLEAKQLKVLPLYEELEGVIYTANGAQLLVACGAGNVLRIDTKTWKVAKLLMQDEFKVTRLLHCSNEDQLALVTTEQNILIYSINNSTGTATESEAVKQMECIKQLIGYNDEILDLCFLGDNDRYLAVATNSKHLKLYDTEENMNCTLIAGHSDIIMSLAAAHNLLISASKDCSIRLWKLSHENPGTLDSLCEQSSCHAASIGSVTFTHNGATGFASACQDGSMKVWNLLRDKQQRNSYSFAVRYAAHAHDKEINCVCYALNNKLVATASQDKTAKLWAAESNTLLGIFRGHTRGVWCVRFSPVDQVVLTTSSDCSLRLWSVANFNCLKRFEQECTILRAEFIDHGKFIISAASDGLLKLWNIKTSTCVQSIDEHSDRIWSLAVSNRTNCCFYSGGADSSLIRFNDITEDTRNETLDQRQNMLEQEETLQSLLHVEKQFHKAFVLALTLNKPKATYDIIRRFVRERDNEAISNLVEQLHMDQRVSLLEHIKAWCTNSRHSQVANLVLQNLLGDALANPSARLYNHSNMVEVLTPYVQRHFKRVTELTKELAFLEFIVECM